LETIDGSFDTTTGPNVSEGNLSPLPTPPHPPIPLYAALMIFCAASEKDSEKPANPNSR